MAWWGVEKRGSRCIFNELSTGSPKYVVGCEGKKAVRLR